MIVESIRIKQILEPVAWLGLEVLRDRRNHHQHKAGGEALDIPLPGTGKRCIAS